MTGSLGSGLSRQSAVETKHKKEKAYKMDPYFTTAHSEAQILPTTPNITQWKSDRYLRIWVELAV